MRKQLRTTVDIDAAPERVWAVLTDFARYPDWNPFVTSISGDLAEGSRLRVRLTPPAGRAMTFKPRVTAVEPGRTLEWLGHLAIRGIFDGRHRFELMPTATGTRLTHGESFSGVLVRAMARSLDSSTLAGFVAMNEALKTRVEQTVVSNG
ncbi:MAG: hypothetical protein QOG87_1603 [Actinomycetota bacterium]|jgi:hypothetical protein